MNQSAPINLSVVIPVYNEQDNLPELVERTVAACDETTDTWELILIDDGSADDSRQLIEAAASNHPGKVKGVWLNRNYGQHAAVMAGLSQSIGEVVVTLDADLQNPPEEIPRLYNKAMEGFDVVGSIRQNRDDTLFRRKASALVNMVIRKATGATIQDYGCMLRAYRRQVVDTMLRCPEQSTFIPVLANMFARNITEIEVSHAARTGGDSKYSLWKLINLQFDLLTCVSNLPLRVLGVLGAVISAGSMAFGVLLIILRFVFGAEWAAEGVFTLFAILFLFVGAQFVAMGLLGEYIGRIYLDVRSRPRWLVERVIDGGDAENKSSPQSQQQAASSDQGEPVGDQSIGVD